jgi:anti-sigma regulatory factor (Ser/Thr protein kinase)
MACNGSFMQWGLHTGRLHGLLCATEWRADAGPRSRHKGVDDRFPRTPEIGQPPAMASFSASIDLPPMPTSVPAARHLLLDVLRTWDVPQDRDDAALLVTELVANVIDHVHGEASLTLELAFSDRWLRISVADGSSIRPVVRELEQEQPRGRGLLLVKAIADRWGSEEHRGGKRVWFELSPAAL